MNFLKIYKILLPILLLVSTINPKDNKKIVEDINVFLNKLPAGSKAAILIINPVTQDTVFKQNIFEPVIPASNIKLFTTAVALKLMGPDYLISTKLFTDDIDLTDGTIDGNIYIKGFGNPMFTLKDLDSLVAYFDTLKIKRITGKVIGDDTFFDNVYSRDDWIIQENANVPLPPVSALVLNRNKFTLKLNSNRKYGKLLRYAVIPDYDFVKVNMRARVTKFRTRPRITYHTAPDGFKIKVTGGLRKSRRRKYYAIFPDNPPLFTALALDEKLRKKKITVEGKPATGSTPQFADEIAGIDIPLKKLIAVTNKNSDNFLAECLFKIIGANFSGSQGNSFYATQAVMSFIEENDIYIEGSSIVDGSGISRFNKITVAAIVDLLDVMYNNKEIFPEYLASLAIAGEDGTLEERFNSSIVRNNFFGKTGTLNGVSAISGYLKTRNNNDLIVSIIIEFNRNGANFYRNIQDEIIEALAENL